jgi:hypothetical protein
VANPKSREDEVTTEAQDVDESVEKSAGKKKMPPWLKKKTSKSDDDDESADEDEDDDSGDSDSDDDDGESMEKKRTKKSLRTTPASLEKALRKLQDFYESNDTQTRKERLFAKSRDGNLSKSEKQELLRLIDGSDAQPEESLGKSAAAEVTASEDVARTIEVSDYLRAQADGLCKGMQTLGDAIEGHKSAQHEHNLLMAQVLCDIGHVVKSLSETHEQKMEQPVRAPKARGVVQPMQKSFGEGERPTVDHNIVRSALLEMTEKSFAKGLGGRSDSGNDLSKAVTMFESSRELPAPIVEEVKAYLQSKRRAG